MIDFSRESVNNPDFAARYRLRNKPKKIVYGGKTKNFSKTLILSKIF